MVYGACRNVYCIAFLARIVFEKTPSPSAEPVTQLVDTLGPV